MPKPVLEATATEALPDWRQRASSTRRQRSEKRILVAARRLFTKEGFEATTVEAIAADAGVGPATIYNRFGTKSAIVAAVIAESVEPLSKAVHADLAKRTPIRDAIESHLIRTAKFLAKHRAMAHALLYALADETRPQPATGRPSSVCLTPVLQTPLTVLVDAGQATGELKTTLGAEEVAMLATNLLILSTLALPTASPSRSARSIVSIVLDGIMPPKRKAKTS